MSPALPQIPTPTRPHAAHLAADADTPTLVHIVLVLAGIAPVHLRVIVTVVSVAMAVAGWRGGTQWSASCRQTWAPGARPPHEPWVPTGHVCGRGALTLALVGTVSGGRLPRLLVEAGAAAVTGTSTCVVLAGTLQPVGDRGDETQSRGRGKMWWVAGPQSLP
jgi:hypothetical protein